MLPGSEQVRRANGVGVGVGAGGGTTTAGGVVTLNFAGQISGSIYLVFVVRELGLSPEVIGMTVVDPVRDERGWAFRSGLGHSEDPVNGFQFLSAAYHATDPNYRGRVTVPVLWDKQTKRIVSNSDDDLLRMFNREFSELAASDYDFYPAELAEEIDAVALVIPTSTGGAPRSCTKYRQPRPLIALAHEPGVAEHCVHH